MHQYRGSGNSFLKHLKCLLTVCIPNERSVFLAKPNQRAGDLGETFDKSSVEVAETEVGLNLLDVLWN